jgi:hypothetical protein
MSNLDLRPLSLGEILDRTFTLYRRNFLLFIGITALPHLLILALQLLQVMLASNAFPTPGRPPVGHGPATAPSSSLLAFGIFGVLIWLVVYLVTYLLAQGGTVFAVSDLYLGRSTSIGASLGRMRGQMMSLFGVTVLNGLAIIGATIFLIIPGIYLACRLITCVPAALLEDLGARESLERSFALTKGSAGRSFVIYLLYFVLIYAAILLFMFPFSILAVVVAAKDPSMVRIWLAFSQVGNFLASTLVTPILTIATAVFYYDLRVRKEAFDLQFMMNPTGSIPSTATGAPSLLS